MTSIRKNMLLLIFVATIHIGLTARVYATAGDNALLLQRSVKIDIHSTESILATHVANSVAARPSDFHDKYTELVFFECELNGRLVTPQHGKVLKVVDGDHFVLKGIKESRAAEVLNFKGFTPAGESNSGQDIGYDIVLAPSKLMRKYRHDAEAKGADRYEIVRETPGMPWAHFFVDIYPCRIEKVVLRDSNDKDWILIFNDTLEATLPRGKYQLVEAICANPGYTQNSSRASSSKLISGHFTLGETPVSVSVRLIINAQSIGTLKIVPLR